MDEWLTYEQPWLKQHSWLNAVGSPEEGWLDYGNACVADVFMRC